MKEQENIRSECAKEAKRRICNNLKKAVALSGMNQKKFASLTNVAGSTLSSYLNSEAIPPIDFLMAVCRLNALKAYCLNVGMFLEENPDFTAESPESEGASRHGELDFYNGLYTFYYIDRFDSGFGDIDNPIPLRTGVMYIYRGSRAGSDTAEVCCRTFSDCDDASELYSRALNALGRADASGERQESVSALIRSGSDYFSGTLSCRESSVFIMLENQMLGSSSYAVFRAPVKKNLKSYGGGVGCMLSVADGRKKYPFSGKLLLSRAPLSASENEIAKSLVVRHNKLALDDEIDSLTEFAARISLGCDNRKLSFLTGDDKKGLFAGRVRQILESYLTKFAFCTVYVEDGEDEEVSEMLARYSK